MAMDKGAADSYVYAKASGMLAKSFIGSRAVRLFEPKTLQELWGLLFKEALPVVPETILAKTLETEAKNKFVAEYKKLVENYSNPAPILIALLHYYDFDNIKQIGTALAFKEKNLPEITDINPFNYIKYKNWPDIKSMTENSPLAWYDRIPELSEQQTIDFKLDWQYVREVWAASALVDSSCRSDIQALLAERIKIDSVLWALRLRKYYEMPGDIVALHLEPPLKDDSVNGAGVFVEEAVKTLDWALDDWDSWKNWKYSSLLNPHEEGVVWNIDPRWIYNSFKKMYVNKAAFLFHKYPFTECPILCWYIIKRNELDNIRAASESLRLHIPASQSMQMAGVLEVNNG